jgi:protein phosphatase
MVADGMGGHAAGEVASAGVLEAMRDFLREHGSARLARPDDARLDAATREGALPPDPDATWSDPSIPAVGLLYDAIDYANHSLFAQNRANDRVEGGGMGTTLTGFWRARDEAPMIFFHVGDSRLYRQRGGLLEQLTRDQTMYQQALEAGMVENLPARNLLLQAVGPSPHVTPEVRSLQVKAGDVLMLCSDGLHGSVPHGEIEAELAMATEQTLEPACARLIALAKEYGGRDNITVMLMACQG